MMRVARLKCLTCRCLHANDHSRHGLPCNPAALHHCSRTAALNGRFCGRNSLLNLAPYSVCRGMDNGIQRWYKGLHGGRGAAHSPAVHSPVSSSRCSNVIRCRHAARAQSGLDRLRSWSHYACPPASSNFAAASSFSSSAILASRVALLDVDFTNRAFTLNPMRPFFP